MISSVVFLGTLNSSVRICKYTASGQFLAGQAGCYNLVPVFEWITHCIISIFLVFMIAFLPLFLQGMLFDVAFSPTTHFHFSQNLSNVGRGRPFSAWPSSSALSRRSSRSSPLRSTPTRF